MKHTIITQKDIIEDDTLPYDNIKIRIMESDIELQQVRDIVLIHKRTFSKIIKWLVDNGCEMIITEI